MTDFWSQDPREALRPGPAFDLATFDRAGTPGWTGTKADAAEHIAGRADLLSELQERLFAHGRSGGNRNVLVVVQGLDTAGKGGIARHVMGLVDPQGVSMRSFGVPTPEELRHHYLWRIKKALPKPGMIGLFDRSHYEDVLVVRVDELVEPDVWGKRYAEINRWEKQLVDSGTVLLKFALMVSHDEQGKRLMERIDRPDKRWKYSAGDVDTRLKWDDFQEAYADVFRLTDTDHAPWHVVPADRKWYSRVAITEVLTRTLIDLDLRWPKPRWRPDAQRRRLLKTMSPQSFAESVAETEATVMEAIAESTEVSQEVAQLRTQGADNAKREAALAAVDAKREELLADLTVTLEQKRALLDEVAPELAAAAVTDDPADEPNKSKKDKKSKDKSGKKSKDKDKKKKKKKKD